MRTVHNFHTRVFARVFDTSISICTAGWTTTPACSPIPGANVGEGSGADGGVAPHGLDGKAAGLQQALVRDALVVRVGFSFRGTALSSNTGTHTFRFPVSIARAGGGAASNLREPTVTASHTPSVASWLVALGSSLAFLLEETARKDLQHM